MSIKARNRLEMLRGVVACEVPATRQGCRAFAAIFPPSGESDDSQWTARKIEIPEGLVDQYFGDSDITESRVIRTASLEEAENTLVSWGVDTSQLDAPWNCDFPL